nr:amino acid ABC transporter permease [Desulfobacula sp.]
MLSPFFQELLNALNRGLVMSMALILPSALGGVLVGIMAGCLRAFGDPFRIDAYAMPPFHGP